MFNESIYTIEEVAQHLRVPVDAVKKEISAGRLEAINVGGFMRVREAALAQYKNSAATSKVSELPVEQSSDFHLDRSQDFRHVWPDGKDEQFTNVHEGTVTYNGRSYRVKLGFTQREAAGKKRRRALVIVDRYPTVEFVAPDMREEGALASIIKDRSGKQVPVGAPALAEYEGLPLAPYRSVVDGPGAPNGLAVIADQNDFDTMIKHALIRYRYREERSA